MCQTYQVHKSPRNIAFLAKLPLPPKDGTNLVQDSSCRERSLKSVLVVCLSPVSKALVSASHVQAYWAHLGHVTYKKEVLSIRQLEAMAEKQPRSRKELCMLLTDKQQDCGSCNVLSLAVDSERKAKVGVVAIHSLRVACLTSKNRETASQHDTF